MWRSHDFVSERRRRPQEARARRRAATMNSNVCCSSTGGGNETAASAGQQLCHAAETGGGAAIDSVAFQSVVYLMYSAVFVVALVGNGLVCYVVLFSAQMRSVTNLFIMNMAVGDLLMTLFCVPFSFVATLLLQYWPFGDDLCRTVSFAQAVAVLVRAAPLPAPGVFPNRAV